MLLAAMALGEFHAIRLWAEQMQARGYRLVVLMHCPDSRTVLARDYPDYLVLPLLLDLPTPVEALLDAYQPQALVVAEFCYGTPLNLFYTAHRRGVKLLLLNGRDAINQVYHPAGWFTPYFYQAYALFDALHVVSRETESRIRALGAFPVPIRVGPDLKHEPRPLLPSQQELSRLLAQVFEPSVSPTLLLASTHPGEESWFLSLYTALRALFPGLKLWVAPRFLSDVAVWESLLSAQGFTSVRRTQLTALPETAYTALLLDTLGELPALYPLSTVVFMGATLQSYGHNLFEPLAAGVPVVLGSSPKQNQDQVRQVLAAEAGFQIQTREEALAVIARLLSDPAYYNAVSLKAQALSNAMAGASQSLVDWSLASLGEDTRHPPSPKEALREPV